MSEIHCHDNQQNFSGHKIAWRDPDGDHAYRGTGTSAPGTRGTVWTPCTICGKKKDHRKHGLPWRTCNYCGSMHPQDLIDRPEPDMMRSVDVGMGPPVDIPNVSWADWKYGYPHKLYIDYGPGLRAKFYSRHLQDHPELIEPFNERFGYLGVIFGLDDNGLWWKRKVVE